ncbi:MAG: hypothetical protein HY314_11300 [Acidobacteria bacterium]|nr:hypothetical protein [Acidobacteriota bacterium]
MVQQKVRARVSKLLACVGFLGFVGLTYAFSSGPLPGLTGAPGEGNCTECHDSFGEETNRGSGSLTITAPPRYETGRRLTITVSLSQPGQRRWGFEITACATETNEPAGRFVITDPTHTQLVQGENGRFYVEHTQAGSYAGQTDGATWTFDWMAPETDMGPVAFYAAGNAANNDNTRLGDWIYTVIASVAPPSYPAVTLLSPKGAEVLGVGERFTIQWDAFKADNFDVLFFPRPGALPDTLVYSLPGDARSYEWTVPETVGDATSIAIVAYNDAGSTTAESDRILIVHKSPALVELLEPNDPRVLQGGTCLTITWKVDSKLAIARQQVRLSVDGGRRYSRILAASVPADARSFTWPVPTNLQTPSARVLVLVRTTGDNLLADANDSDFVICNPKLKADH